ncbi:MAG: UDP-N-acetylmuramoyl-tripeptide--D-alanyl-D-alanine ligase [Ruminococcaceae bacterium]|nr:UDP-N-acetylmuramoyl-tripeptide--D-alanyl-D-alanine ligase [Oscillospiraceae bacterium]
MKNLTLENILTACRGVWHGDDALLGKTVSAVVTDSRRVSAGCLFAAIPGERVDGHDFAAAALHDGALCVLAQRIPAGAEGNFILVPDTVAALQAIAGFYRAGFDIPVLGITGSVGKTTAKEMVASVLSQRFCVHKTSGNFNNDLGVALTLFGIEERHEAVVVEMGISHPGDMVRLAEIVRPTAALYTVIGDAHLEFLRSREGIFAEKTVINRYLPEQGLVFCNGDDNLLAGMECAQRALSFGLGDGCDVRAENARTLGDSTACTVSCGDRRFDVCVPAYGEHMLYAVAEGAAVGIAFGLSDEEIAAGIAAYETVGHRARRIETGKLTVIDDCYNANPTSTASALRSLARCDGRRVAVLGDMLELGGQSAALHYETGALAAQLGIELVLCTGEASRETARGAGACGRHFAEKDALIAALAELVREGDTVLVKASRSMRFEDITSALETL